MAEGSTSSLEEGAPVHGRREGQSKALTMLQVSSMTIKHGGSASSWEKGALVHGRRECQFMGEGSTSSWEERVPVHGRREH